MEGLPSSSGTTFALSCKRYYSERGQVKRIQAGEDGTRPGFLGSTVKCAPFPLKDMVAYSFCRSHPSRGYGHSGMTRNKHVTVFFLRSTVLFDVQGKRTVCPVTPWTEIFLEVMGPIRSVKTE